MRPGRTPENVPYQDLPIGDSDPGDPVPWPHFQQIEWHHQWEPPHEHPVPMELFIEQQGRWATPEMEAAMRAGVRQSVRDRQELAEREKREMIITDDDDDEDYDQVVDADDQQELGDGVFGKLGSAADQAATAAATTAAPTKAKEGGGAEQKRKGEGTAEQFDEDDGLDDFLLDLGLDLDLDGDDDEDEDAGETTVEAAGGSGNKSSSAAAATTVSVDDDDDEEEDEVDDDASTGSIDLALEDDDDDDLVSGGIGADVDDDVSGVDTVPLEDFGDNDNDTLDTEDIFDEGGFDFDDGDFDGGDGGDEW